ncbi:hypothetical protein SAMN05428976_10817 [Clostridium sp. USBA 49]|jgi:hypothetical protein|uniref:hypothetical protein n=1 Tax=Clostridium TaxID=1485 RepID=UPI000999547A|nr:MULTISPECIES: hypothetical protein [Clostridium]SKA85851.1 hypothetical protein SAMN05428976_10817 [Clostridium sp. USBA 49]
MPDLNGSLVISALIIILMVIIYFLYPKIKSDKKYDTLNEKEELSSDIILSDNKINEDEKQLELVAAIMGALSAYMDIQDSNLKIKSIKRVDGTKSTWRKEGIVELLEEVR